MEVENGIPEEGTSPSITDTLRDQLANMPDFEAEEAAERARDEQGRFAAKQAEERAPEQAPEITDPAQGVQPPVSWSKEDRAVFATLPPNVQELLSRREREMTADYTRKTQEIAEVRRFSDEVKPIIDRHAPLIAHAGVPAGQVLDQLFSLYEHSQRDPVGYIKWAAQSMNVDLSALQPAPVDEYVDPGVQELRNQNQALLQQVQSVSQYIQQQQTQQVQSQIESFAKAADETGQPMRPHFDKVKGEMSRLLGAGIVNTLEEAYDRAVWSDPSIREDLIKPKQVAPAVEAAKRVKNIRSSGLGPATDTATGSLRDTLRDAMAKAG